ncbi:tRNA epoxyqueuosine(34) reductase QueG [Lacibacterium aquatile]|uniref:Epoxyqueuosine reductase n=1 Tax=Lacibacterium aquatile TaxID=1168082 RepID=A0ABW5DLW6_9PROT
MTATTDIKAQIRAEALRLGFDVVGYAPASLPEVARERLAEFLAAGKHGDMGWLAGHQDRRGNPDQLWPDARSIIVVGANYAPGHDPLALADQPERGAISVYARNKDYHDTLKKRLRQLGEWIGRQFGGDARMFVDTAPVMEKPLAMQAGLGWQGKHTNLVSRDFGSWLFLGELFTSLDLAPDGEEEDHCGRCTRCLSACPTDAFDGPYKLDGRKCISYLTIENKGPIPHHFRAAIGNRIYGCDDCLAVCPWNKFARPTHEPDFLPRIELTAPRLADLSALDDTDFRALFAGSPIKRIGRGRFVRNVLIALGNSGSEKAVPAVIRLLSDADPLVRGAAVWALSCLAPDDLARRQSLAAYESDDTVLAEWSLLKERLCPAA